MGLFKRKPNPEKELASALARRGVAGRATVVELRATGATRDEAAREIEFTLDLALPDGTTVRTVHRQYMNRFTLHGLAPGEPARVMYDRDDPQTVMVRGHPRFRTDVVAGEIVIVEVQDLDAPTSAG
ncbi:hypothetical protein [Conexibacter sp. CPCC 206217]|uniref:hypothetical protein n=1 Tax=Conexibacter sp. CPCC 206217 TaxID=3064574 RepID=UPI00271CF36E|nr:hypothetical protein [Conexibacter sp. CPCC 206217]MDO8210080.1 hypothetical protein [Conexibacter sp. CPCC 206217]